MAQRRILRSLAATAVLRCLALGLAHAKESRSVPRRAGDGTSDARETAIDLTVPEEAVIHHGHVVRCSLPFAHQDGAGSRKRCCGRPGRAGGAVTKCARKQPVEFLGDRPGEPSIEPFLPRISNGEGKNVTPQGRWWLVAKLPLPKCPQFCPRQFFEHFEIDVHNRLVTHGGSSQWPGGIAVKVRLTTPSASIVSRSGARRSYWSCRLAGRLAFARGIFGHDAIDPLHSGLLGHERQAELLAHHAGKEPP